MSSVLARTWAEAFCRMPAGGDIRNVTVFDTGIAWDANTFINIAFLVLIALLLVRFLRTGGIQMLRHMAMPPQEGAQPLPSVHTTADAHHHH